MMRGIAAAAALVLALLAPNADATARSVGTKRVTILPGFSVALPAGWFGCGDLAKRLPAPSGDAETIQTRLCKPSDVWKEHLIFLQGRTGIDLRARTHDLPLTDSIARAMDADMIKGLTAKVCESIGKSYTGEMTIENCVLSQRSAGGHYWLVASFVIAPTDGHRKIPVRQAMVQYGNQSIELQFALIAASPAEGDAIVDWILGSVEIDAARAPSAAVAPLIQVGAAPGVMLSVPRGWRSCKPDIDALLGNAAGTPIVERDDTCEPPLTKGMLAKAEWTIVMAQLAFRNTWLGVAHNAGQTVSQRELDLVRADLVGEIAKAQCARISNAYAEANTTSEDCEAHVETIAGHNALVTHIVVKMAKYPAKLAVRIFVIPYAQGQIAILVMTPVFLEAETKPEIDRILATLAIE